MRPRSTGPTIKSGSGSSEAAVTSQPLLALALLGLMGCRDPAVQARPQTMDKADIHWGSAVNGLRPGVASSAGFAELSLENVGAQPLQVLSHVNAGEVHLDWYSLRLRDDKGAVRELHLLDDRDKAGQVQVTLAPGQSLKHRVDVQRWAGRPANGSASLHDGVYELRAVYEVEPSAQHWSGKLEAGPTTLNIAKTK